MESLERASILSEQIYLIFNSLTIYIYVGKDCDPYFLTQLFKVDDLSLVDKFMSEEEMFADMETSVYLTSLYSIINQIRY